MWQKSTYKGRFKKNSKKNEKQEQQEAVLDRGVSLRVVTDAGNNKICFWARKVRKMG